MTLEEKITRGLALNASELIQATGYGRREIKRLGVLVEGKCTLEDFKAHVREIRANRSATTVEQIHSVNHHGRYVPNCPCCHDEQPLKATPESTAGSNDLRSLADKLRAPSSKRDQQGASFVRELSQTRSIL